jgi:uncharacterized C2H2 Zn-finger protein
MILEISDSEKSKLKKHNFLQMTTFLLGKLISKRIYKGIVMEIQETYKCPNCVYKSTDIYNYKRHINNKVCEGKKYTCPECQKLFQNKSNLNKHFKTIHSHPENPQVKIGSGSMDQSNLSNIKEAIINNIKGNNNNVVIIVNSLGRENLEFMTDEYFISFMEYLTQEDSNGMIKIMTDIHYDQNRPENHNICVTDLRRKKILFKTTSEGVNNVVEGVNAKPFVIRFMVKLGNIVKNRYNEFKKSNGVEEFSVPVKIDGIPSESIDAIEELIEKSERKDPSSQELRDFYKLLYTNRKKVIQYLR